MTKSELINILAEKHRHFSMTDVKSAVDMMLEYKIQSLASGERIEIRDFGSFNIRHQPPRTARNPKTGETVPVLAKYKIHFKPGKELKYRINTSSDSRPPSID